MSETNKILTREEKKWIDYGEKRIKRNIHFVKSRIAQSIALFIRIQWQATTTTTTLCVYVCTSSLVSLVTNAKMCSHSFTNTQLTYIVLFGLLCSVLAAQSSTSSSTMDARFIEDDNNDHIKRFCGPVSGVCAGIVVYALMMWPQHACIVRSRHQHNQQMYFFHFRTKAKSHFKLNIFMYSK